MNAQIKTPEIYLEGLAGAPTLAKQAWTESLRRRGREDFSARGLPSVRDEEWRYTNVSALAREPYIAVKTPGKVEAGRIDGYAISGLAVHRLVFVDGFFAPQLSASTRLARGVSATNMAGAMASRAKLCEAHLGRQVPADAHGFTALNTAQLGDGAFVHVEAGVAVEQAIELLFVASGADQAMIQPRSLIVAEAGSRVRVIERYVAAGDGRYLTNAVTEVYAGEGAEVEHYRIQQESAKAYHINALYFDQQRDSRVTAHGVDFGGLLTRNDLRVRLNAEGAHCALNGLYAVDGRQHVDNHTRVDHFKPRATSREFYKGVLDGRARAVFAGRVVVHLDAQGSDAEQLNNNLLLSRDAEVDTKPQLEIYADDVKCSHGATVGSLDADALYYLRSRALDEEAARDLLTYAFANDVLARMSLKPLRLALERGLTARLLRGREIKEMELV